VIGAALAMLLPRIRNRISARSSARKEMFYNRQSLPLDKFLRSAKNSIDIYGITLEETIKNYTTTFHEILRNPNVRIRILMCSPVSPLIDKIERQVNINIKSVSSAYDAIAKFWNGLSDEEKERLAFRLSNEIPVQSIYIIDRLSETAIIRGEVYLFGIGKEDRRLYEISKNEEKHYFDTITKSYERLWSLGIEPSSIGRSNVG
jgi:hypothetical protein